MDLQGVGRSDLAIERAWPAGRKERLMATRASLVPFVRFAFFLLIPSALGCASEAAPGNVPHYGVGGSGGSGGFSGSGALDASVGVPDVGIGGQGGLGDAAVCARESKRAEALPVDMYIMLDKSTSMHELDPTGTKIWDGVKAALSGFFADPGAAGTGVGLQYFGLGTSPASCDVAQYANPAVAIAPLPGVAAAVQSSLDNQFDFTFTPTGSALQGALQYAKGWAAQHPTRQTIVVLATDGLPTECSPRDIGSIADMAAEALKPPAVYTFVIGFGPEANLDTIAVAGGTRAAFFLDPTKSVATEFARAMRNIVTAPISCEFAVPKSTTGAPVDTDKINVDFTSSNGGKTELYRVMNSGECETHPQGWFYDNPNAPTKILICPAACQNFGAGQLDIVLGCGTRPPPL
jgi:von Willebrand factor type A domain-containing protein